MALEKTVHILKQSQRELELIVSDPFVQVRYGHSFPVSLTNTLTNTHLND